MTAPYIDEGLRAPLSDFFEVLEETLRSAGERGEELTERDALLDVVFQFVCPALDQEMQAAGPSGAAAFHLPHFASVLVERVGLPRRGAAATPYQPLLAANKRLKDALSAARRRRENEAARDAEILKELILAVPGQVFDRLQPDFVALGAVVETVPGQVSNQLQPSFTALDNDVQAVPGQVANQLQPGLTALDNAIQGLPAELIDSLPTPIANAVVAAITAVQDKVTQDIEALTQLAATPLATAIKSPADGISFLGDVVDALSAVEADGIAVPADAVQPVTNAVLGVFNFAAPGATIDQLNNMIDLKQQIAAILQPAAPAPLAQPGGIE
jgi:hypothetical protein